MFLARFLPQTKRKAPSTEFIAPPPLPLPSPGPCFETPIPKTYEQSIVCRGVDRTIHSHATVPSPLRSRPTRNPLEITLICSLCPLIASTCRSPPSKLLRESFEREVLLHGEEVETNARESLEDIESQGRGCRPGAYGRKLQFADPDFSPDNSSVGNAQCRQQLASQWKVTQQGIFVLLPVVCHILYSWVLEYSMDFFGWWQ